MKKLIKLFFALVLILIVLAVVGLFSLGRIVKAGVERVGPAVTKVPVHLDAANISVFSGGSTLKGFVLSNPEGYKSPQAIKVGSMSLDLSRRSIFSDKVVIHSIKLEAPEINYEADLRGGNLKKILDNISSGEKKPSETKPSGDKPAAKGKGAERKLQVDEFVISGAKVTVSSALTASYPVTLPEIRLTNLGQGPDGITAAELSRRVMNAIVEATTKAVAENSGKLGGGAAETLKKGASGIGDLFNKK